MIQRLYPLFLLFLFLGCGTDDDDSGITQPAPVEPSGLPAMHLQTDWEVNSRDDYVAGELSGPIAGMDSTTLPVSVRGRGNSTWNFPKKGYQIRFEEKTSLLGMPPDKKWIMLAEYSDKTLLRNHTAFALSRQSDLSYTPQGRFADVYLNGDYHGVYHFTQKAEVSDNRLDLSDEGFLLEVDQLSRLDEDDVYFETERRLFNIKEPDLTIGSPEFLEIRNYVLDFEAALYGDNFTDPELGYARYLDVDAFIDWYFVNELAKNVDAAFHTSVYLHKPAGGKLTMGPVWDFDIGFGNINYNGCDDPTGFYLKDRYYTARLFEDPAFVEKVKARLPHFETGLADLLAEIRQAVTALEGGEVRNDDRWNVIGVYVWPNNVVLDSYEEEVDYLVDWIGQRYTWLGENIRNL
ncbi:hypothetical protein CEQ90_13420 [Lewinellaceae bacterium SD302]|nr:hypothetical protein CEQ90_13420 [Lewinellaceae bacterium SD302]